MNAFLKACKIGFSALGKAHEVQEGQTLRDYTKSKTDGARPFLVHYPDVIQRICGARVVAKDSLLDLL